VYVPVTLGLIVLVVSPVFHKYLAPGLPASRKKYGVWHSVVSGPISTNGAGLAAAVMGTRLLTQPVKLSVADIK
jgi:hypothetical protein